ncbi:MAG: glycosyltransferase family 9 protein, partial [Chloroflexi bacterium]|nr:glycosyltransferase family 9 protein [Chloroflexota bacterium]
MASTVNPRRLLAVKLADLGDALTATPALRACRETWPEAQMDVLTTTAGAAALKGLDSIDRLYVADKHAFDRPAASLTALLRVAPLLMTLRGHRYDVVLLMHHLTTPYGALKYLLLKAALSGRQTAGLDNGRGRFLDLRATDRGFGWRHEVDYNLAVAEAAGARLGHDPLIEIALSEADRDFARQRLAGSGEWVAVHAGGGSYSLARRWAPAEFAAVARQLDLPIVLLGTQVDRAANAEVARLAGGGSLDLTGQTTAKQTASLLER